MKPVVEMSQAELAAFVQTHLQKRGIKLVLTGGAVVAIYSHDRYVSLDIDLVNIYSAKRGEIHAAMDELSFTQQGRHYRHSDSQYIVDFIPGPLTIGAEPVAETEQMQFETGQLILLTPTDCVKDRLSAYYHWQDRQCLSQAILITKTRQIDLNEIERWSKAEGKLDEFNEIKSKFI